MRFTRAQLFLGPGQSSMHFSIQDFQASEWSGTFFPVFYVFILLHFLYGFGSLSSTIKRIIGGEE